MWWWLANVGAEDGAEIESNLVEGDDANEGDTEVADELAQDHDSLRGETRTNKARGEFVDDRDEDEPKEEDGSRSTRFPKEHGIEEVGSCEEVGQGGGG